MFDIGASELLVIVIVAVIFIGPKELPRALRTAGSWIGKIRKVSTHFRTGLDAMVREAEMEDMEKKWKGQNAKIMAENPGDASAEGAVGTQVDTEKEGAAEKDGAEMTPLSPPADSAPEVPEKVVPEPTSPQAPASTPDQSKAPAGSEAAQPQLPLGKPKAQ